MLWCSLSNVYSATKKWYDGDYIRSFVWVNVCPFIWYGIAISVNNKRNVCHILEMVSPILVFHLVVFNKSTLHMYLQIRYESRFVTVKRNYLFIYCNTVM